jgi:hypothetical protein
LLHNKASHEDNDTKACGTSMANHWSEDDETWCDGILAADDGDLSQWEYLTRNFDNPAFLPEQPLQEEMAMDAVEQASSRVNAHSEYNPLPYRRHSAARGVAHPMETDDEVHATMRQTWPGTMPGTNFGQQKATTARYEQSFERIDTSPISFDHQFNSQDDRFAVRSMRDAALHQEPRFGLDDGESTSGSSCGVYSTYPPTPDNASIPDSLHQIQAAFEYVFTPRISEMLQSDAFASHGPLKSTEKHFSTNTRNWRSLLPRSSAAVGTNDGGKMCPSFFSQIGEVGQSKIPARDYVDNDMVSTNKTSTLEPLAIMCPPLTAYNYFYRSERDTIVQGMTHPDDPLPPVDWNFTSAKKAELLHHHWYVGTAALAFQTRLLTISKLTIFLYGSLSFHRNVDPFKKKRKHRKSHGFIEFTAYVRAFVCS